MGCDIHVYLLKRHQVLYPEKKVTIEPIDIVRMDSWDGGFYLGSVAPWWRNYAAFAFLGYGGRYMLSPDLHPVSEIRGKYPFTDTELERLKARYAVWSNLKNEKGEKIFVNNIYSMYLDPEAETHSHTWFTSTELKKSLGFLKSIKHKYWKYDLDEDEYNSILWMVEGLDRWGRTMIELEEFDDDSILKNEYIFCVCWDS